MRDFSVPLGDELKRTVKNFVYHSARWQRLPASTRVQFWILKTTEVIQSWKSYIRWSAARIWTRAPSSFQNCFATPLCSQNCACW